MVAEGDVGGHVEPGGLERLLGAVHQARVGGPAGERARRRVGVVELRRRALDVVVVVLDAGVVAGGFGRRRSRAERAAQARVAEVAGSTPLFGFERAALEQRPHPLGLVQLLAVGRVAGVDREVHRPVRVPSPSAIGLAPANAFIWRIIASSICGFIASLGRQAALNGDGLSIVDELDPRRRFLVGELEVRELAEVGERGASRIAAGLSATDALLAHDVWLAGPKREPAEAAVGVGDDSLLDRREPERLGTGGTGPGGAETDDGEYHATGEQENPPLPSICPLPCSQDQVDATGPARPVRRFYVCLSAGGATGGVPPRVTGDLPGGDSLLESGPLPGRSLRLVLKRGSRLGDELLERGDDRGRLTSRAGGGEQFDRVAVRRSVFARHRLKCRACLLWKDAAMALETASGPTGQPFRRGLIGAAWDRRIAAGLGLLVLLGLILRLPYFTDALFGDEVSTYVVVHGNSLSRMMQLIHSDQEVTPPLYFLFASLTQHLGNSSDWLRLAPMIGGLASIPLTYLLGLRTVGRPAAIVGATLVCLSPFLIFYSTEARAYALSMAICLGSTLALLKALEDGRLSWWGLYALLSAAAMYTHYSNLFLLAAQAAWVLIAHRRVWRPLVFSNLAAAVAFVPWLPAYFEDQNSPGALVIEQISPFDFHLLHVELSRLLLGTPYQQIRDIPGTLGAVAIGSGLVIGLISMAVLAWRSGNRIPSPGAALIPILAGSTVVGLVVYSLLSVDVFAARNMINVWPAWALLVGAIVTSAPRRIGLAASVLVIGGFAIGAVRSQDANQQRPDYDAAARYLVANSATSDPIVDSTVAGPGAKQALEIALADIGDESQPEFRVGLPTLADAQAVRAPGGPGQFAKPPIPPAREIAHEALRSVRNDRLFFVSGGDLDLDQLRAFYGQTSIGRFLAALPPGYQQLSRRHFPGLLGGFSVYEIGPPPGP